MSRFLFQDSIPPDSQRKTVLLPVGLKTKRELLDFLQGAVPLPDYFGENWDALEECLADLDWLPEKKLLLSHRDIPLAETADQRIYLSILAAAVKASPHLQVAFPEKLRRSVENGL
jgi:hypothetical protein